MVIKRHHKQILADEIGKEMNGILVAQYLGRSQEDNRLC